MERYKDEWGEIWTRIERFFVQRDSDGNIGLWDNGRGLERIYW